MTLCSGTSFASFLLGLPGRGNVTSGGEIPRNANRINSQLYYGVYFQDDWRVTSKLTINSRERVQGV